MSAMTPCVTSYYYKIHAKQSERVACAMDKLINVRNRLANCRYFDLN